MPDEFVKAAKVTDLPEDGDMMAVDIGAESVLIARVEGKYYAIDNECTHAGGPLSEGELEGPEVECPFHSGMFDVRTGEVTGEPPYEPVAAYAVKVEGEDILVGPTAPAA